MIRILHVYPQLNNAGTEMVIMNLYNNMDKTKVQFDFLVEKEGELDETIVNMGGKIYYLKEKNRVKYFRALLSFFSSHKEYNIVHTHTHGRMGLVLKAANKKGVNLRIAHSHNSRSDLPKVFKIYKKISSRNIENNATNLFACSSAAAEWLFPRNHSKAKIVKNSIELEKFIYNKNARKKFRSENNINENTKIVCHVGRFAKEKNHEFIIEVANELFKKDDSIKLILVGVGPLEKDIKDLAEEHGIRQRIIFLGNRKDVSDILCASDIFILPSLHEGLGIVLIEAQANGLNCVASSGVPIEADLGMNLLEIKNLSEGPLSWANSLYRKLLMSYDREKISYSSLSSQYDIKKTANFIQKFYLDN